MKKFNLLIVGFCLIIFLTGCEIIGNIFKAGMWTGIIIVVLIIALLIFLLKKSGRK